MENDCSNGMLDDMEDLFLSQEITPNERYRNKKLVTVRPIKKHCVENDEHFREKQIWKSVIPGTQTIYIKTWGCAHNNSDSEYMAGILSLYGYKLTEDKWDADLWLLNSCTVKNPAEDHFRNEIELGRSRGRHVVVAGCVPQGMPRSGYLQGLSIIGVQQIDRIIEVVEETLKGHTVRLFGKKKGEDGKKIGGAPLLLPKVRKNPLIEIIAINTGCLNQCTYCKTKHARGELGSYPPEEIIERAKQSFQEGVCEIWLTSEDTGTYGRDIGTSLPDLLDELVKVIPEGCRLRLGMTNPPYILEHLERMAVIFQHPRVYRFLHVPVQSGSDQVLSDMKREYTRSEFERVVDYLRSSVSGMTIATDIICGFPTETDKDFDETVEMCSRYEFPSLFINQYFPRPGTIAAKMKKIPAQDVKRRTKLLTELFNSYSTYTEKRINEIQKVLVTDISHDKKYFVSHNIYYEQVLVPKEQNLMGKLVEVRITKVSKFCMFGQPLNGKISTPGISPPLLYGQVSGCEMTKTSEKPDSFMTNLIKFAIFVLCTGVIYGWLK